MDPCGDEEVLEYPCDATGLDAERTETSRTEATETGVVIGTSEIVAIGCWSGQQKDRLGPPPPPHFRDQQAAKIRCILTSIQAVITEDLGVVRDSMDTQTSQDGKSKI